jgi:hypothetical protein
MADSTPLPSQPGSSSGVVQRFTRWLASLIPPELLADPETARRARLMMQFGILGSFFGLAYAARRAWWFRRSSCAGNIPSARRPISFA